MNNDIFKRTLLKKDVKSVDRLEGLKQFPYLKHETGEKVLVRVLRTF